MKEENQSAGASSDTSPVGREAFEERFPVPEGAEFNEAFGSYQSGVYTEKDRLSIHNAQWRAWQAGAQAGVATRAAPEQQEPVAEIVFDHSLTGPSSVYAELYSTKAVTMLAPGTKLYAGPQPALTEAAARWEFVRQFLELDDVGDDSFCLGLIVNAESMAEAVTPHSSRLYQEWQRARYENCSTENDEPDDSIPEPTVDDAIDAAIAALKETGHVE